MVASLFRAVGLSFKDVGFMKFNLWSPPMAAAAHYSLIMYLKSPISTTVLEKLPVSVDKVRAARSRESEPETGANFCRGRQLTQT